ncbi:18058_t:CDS:2, partial [Funneliformis geosporum]
MPIIHDRIIHSSKVLKDWEGLPIEKETKIKDFLKIFQQQCIAWEAACQYGIFVNFYIISQEITDFSRAPIINAFDILRANSNDIFGGGWKGKVFAQNVGKKFVTDLASAL